MLTRPPRVLRLAMAAMFVVAGVPCGGNQATRAPHPGGPATGNPATRGPTGHAQTFHVADVRAG